jgi:hypothetical protein
MESINYDRSVDRGSAVFISSFERAGLKWSLYHISGGGLLAQSSKTFVQSETFFDLLHHIDTMSDLYNEGQ